MNRRVSVSLSCLALFFALSLFAKKSSFPAPSEQESKLNSLIVKHLNLTPSTTPAQLTKLSYDQQVDIFCLILDLIMDPSCKITHATLSKAFSTYCTEFKTRHPKLYNHFSGTAHGFWDTVSYMKKYNGMDSSEIPAKAVQKRTTDRKAFDKKYSSYLAQYKVMKKVAKKFS
jgi:hypothetical protein